MSNLRDAINMAVDDTRTTQRAPRMPVERALEHIRKMTSRDVGQLTHDTELREAYLKVIKASNVQINEALRG